MQEIGSKNKNKKLVAQRMQQTQNQSEANVEEIKTEVQREDSDDDEDSLAEGIQGPQSRRAKRAWGLVRRHIEDVRVEKRKAAGSINWDFLRQTISAMSDMERARQDLYDKYLYKRNWWTEGLSQCPEHLRRKIIEETKPAEVEATVLSPRGQGKSQNRNSKLRAM